MTLKELKYETYDGTTITVAKISLAQVVLKNHKSLGEVAGNAQIIAEILTQYHMEGLRYSNVDISEASKLGLVNFYMSRVMELIA